MHSTDGGLVRVVRTRELGIVMAGGGERAKVKSIECVLRGKTPSTILSHKLPGHGQLNLVVIQRYSAKSARSQPRQRHV